ncbi:PDR/VanB family oxidoreductase [Paracoccus jeotgali]|uniref:Oxidoreductase n=1 Tax=Paracoccus jeotgali TaxID=2065379 RepID=A0A2K9MHL7_9RHOB|nr:PDR/VanB family oxidoreductase [Paracoccus jeotgali]AUM75120.1 oxidoreductase [Paracoccus jeotgali]
MEQHQEILVRVCARDALADGIVGLTLAPVDGGQLPEWTPGAHLDLKLPLKADDGAEVIRQYSLCGDPRDRSCYRIGVLREAAGRGGSAYVHDRLAPGEVIRINAPRNHFPFEPTARTLFIAGGIGITPILPMVRQAAAEGHDWQLIVATRDRSRLAFEADFAALDPARVTFHFHAEKGLLDLDAVLGPLGAETTVYSCGPTGLLDALTQRSEGAPWQLRIERFAASEPVDTAGKGFDVICASSGERLRVGEGQTILEVVRPAGYKIESSCKDGICGTCETRVLRGMPDHRDSVLTAEERAANDYMMICVSRAQGSELELDI